MTECYRCEGRGRHFSIQRDERGLFVEIACADCKATGIAPSRCDKCGRPRKNLIRQGGEDYPYWLCGTCLHREQRIINASEMGVGRRGY